jgi:hypothetical protein
MVPCRGCSCREKSAAAADDLQPMSFKALDLPMMESLKMKFRNKEPS